MSARFMVKALGMKVGSATRKLVLVKLADNANDNGECWPSISHIAAECEMSERSVHTHLNALIKLGLIAKESRYADNRQRSNFYKITIGEPDDLGVKNLQGGVKNLQGEGEKFAPPGVKNLQTEPPIGTCNRTKEKTRASKKPSTDELMAEIPAGVDQSLWSDWIEHRQEIKKPMTIRAARALATHLKKFQANGHKPDDVLRQSIINGWQGVFEPKEKPTAKTKKRKELS